MNALLHRLKQGISAIVLALLAGCASTTMLSVRSGPDFHAARIHKALVIGFINPPRVRKTFEEEFARQWKARGVEAIPSLNALAPNLPVDKADVAPWARAQGFDCVLVTRLLKREKIESKIAQPKWEQALAGPPEESNLTDYIKGVVASPEYPIDYEMAFLTTNIYDVATGQIIWSGTSQTLITADTPKLARPIIRKLLKNLYKSR